MRVAIVTSIFPPDIGGPATHAYDLLKSLPQRGIDPIVITQGSPSAAPMDDAVISVSRDRPRIVRWFLIIQALIRRRSEIDLIYATGLHGPAAIAAFFSHKPLVVKLVGDPVWERAYRTGRTSKSFRDYQEDPDFTLGLRISAALRNWTLRRASAVVVPASYMKSLVRTWVGKEAVHIRNGVRLVRGPAVRERKDRKIVAVAVGRVIAHKRLDLLIRAVAKVPEVFLEIIGDGPDLPRLVGLVDDLSCGKRVRFLGTLDRAHLPSRLEQADVMVSASSYEGLPHSLIEGLSHALPVICPSIEGFDEAVQHHYNGFLVTPTPEGFAAVLEEISQNPDLHAQLRLGALKSSRQWDLEFTISELDRLLKEVAGHGKG